MFRRIHSAEEVLCLELVFCTIVTAFNWLPSSKARIAIPWSSVAMNKSIQNHLETTVVCAPLAVPTVPIVTT